MPVSLHHSNHATKHPRVLPLIPLVLSLIAGCGCSNIDEQLTGIQDTAQDTVAALNHAIDALERNSAAWQSVLANTSSQLTQDAQSTVRDELSNLLNRSIAAAGSEVRCDIDFIGARVRQALIRIRARLLHQTIPAVEPGLCQVVPPAIDMALDPSRRNELEFFGYDFDTTPITVMLHNKDGTVDVSDKLDRHTHYHMTLNLGANGVPLSSASNRITLEWQQKQISSIAIIQPATPICHERTDVYTRDTYLSFTPPHTRGDTEFKGHGPQVWATAQWTHDDAQVSVRLWMKAEETRSDWTTAEGERVETYYTAPHGWRIERIIGDATSSAHDIDTNHHEDRVGGGPNGPVKEFVFRGDRRGDDAGLYTGVDVYFNPLTVKLVQAANCVSFQTFEALRLEKRVAPVTLERLRPGLGVIGRDLE